MTTQNNNDLEKLIQPDTDTKNPDADVIANLEKEKEELKDDRLEERFLWIVVCIIMVDFAFFANISNWGAALVIGIIEIILIFVLARKFQIDDISKLLDRLIDGWSGRNNHSK